MKGVKPDRKPDPSTGNMVEDFWGPSIKLLTDMKFLDSLKTYNKDNIPIPVMKRIREKYSHTKLTKTNVLHQYFPTYRYMQDREFNPERMRSVSTACEGLCKWVRAMEVYDRVIKIVAPKKARLEEAEGELAAQMETLNEKRAQLKEVKSFLVGLATVFKLIANRGKILSQNPLKTILIGHF